MGIVDEIKSVASTVQKIDNVELYRQILDLQQAAMDSEAEKIKLKEEVSALKEKFKFKQKVIYESEAVWIKDEEGNKTGDPMCSACFQDKGKGINLHDKQTVSGAWFCPICDKTAHPFGVKPRNFRSSPSSRPFNFK